MTLSDKTSTSSSETNVQSFLRPTNMLKVFPDSRLSPEQQIRFRELKDLLGLNIRKYFVRNKRSLDGNLLNIRPCMVGQHALSATPWIIVSCTRDLDVLKSFCAKDYIQKELTADPHSSFGIYACDRSLQLAIPGHESGVEVGLPSQSSSDAPRNACGLKLRRSIYGGYIYGTLGGIITLLHDDGSTKNYGLTTGHFCRPGKAPLRPSDETSDTSPAESNSEDISMTNADNSSDLTSLGSLHSDGETGDDVEIDFGEITKAFGKDWSPNQFVDDSCLEWELLGNIEATSFDTDDTTCNHDWGLINLDNFDMNLQNMIPDWVEPQATRLGSGDFMTLADESVLDLEVPRPVGICRGNIKADWGNLKNDDAAIMVGECKRFTDVYTLSNQGAGPYEGYSVGESGAWVFDASSCMIYGFITALDFFGNASILSLSGALNDIKESLLAQEVMLYQPSHVYRTDDDLDSSFSAEPAANSSITKRLRRTADQAGLTGDGARPNPQAFKERESVTSFFKGLFKKVVGKSTDSDPDINDPTYPVINGATVAPEPAVKNALTDIVSQSGRWASNFGLLGSVADTKLFDGGLADDRKYQMEAIVQLAASLPAGSKTRNTLSHNFISLLWDNLQHPPLSLLGEPYKYRQADGSFNNVLYPHLGKAGQPYARTVKPLTLKPGVLPDPGVIFDSVLARIGDPKEHPNKISSTLFHLASIIIHDLFQTDERDYTRSKTSSYLDLAPLYGNNQDEQNKVRLFKNGLLIPDTFSSVRVLGFPPGVAALLVCFNRYHNYIAMQLKEINENGRFTLLDSNNGGTILDNDLFQTARLITCGLYVNIILTDYVRTILNLNRTNSTWTLDPRANFGGADPSTVGPGTGNQVSCEFNLVYRWHSTISKKDEKWSEDMYKKVLGRDNYADASEEELLHKLRQWLVERGTDPSSWHLDSLDESRYPRNGNMTFSDEHLVEVLMEATEDVACSFGPRQIPVVMKLIEVLGMKQARKWNVATLNEFRRFFKLEPHKSFADITQDEEIAHALEALYQHPDYVELAPGLAAEDCKEPLEPGSGLCPGFTVSRTILADAVALVRGDRFYTIDFTPATLTNWGFNQIKPDPDVAQGGCMYNLIMRALPNWYRGNSVYALYPLTVPTENEKILEKLGKKDLYDFGRPSLIPVPTSIKSWAGVTSVLQNQKDFRVPWGLHTSYVTGHDYMLSDDKPANAEQRAEVHRALFCPINWEAEIRKFYEALTTQLIEINSEKLRGKWYQLDACRDVGNPSHAVFAAQLFSLPLKSPSSLNPVAVSVDQLYLALSVLFAFVFMDGDTARSFKLRSGAKAAGDSLAKLVKLICTEVHVGKKIHIDDLLGMGQSSRLLRNYGIKFIQRLFETGRSVDDVVSAILPTAAAAVATQAQHFAQMLDLYLSPEYNSHWPAIQRLAWSDSDEDFEMLKSYALEANRLRPAAWGLLRRSANNTTINDGPRGPITVSENEQIYTDFVSAGLDPTVFPDPHSINLTRDRSLYIHHGSGPHSCLGRPIVEVAMAAQLKVFGRLRNLRRAPGPQGEMKRTIPSPDPVSSRPDPNPGSISVYMKENWSDWWPFPTQLKVHHDGFIESQEEILEGKTGLPNVDEEIVKTRRENMV